MPVKLSRKSLAYHEYGALMVSIVLLLMALGCRASNAYREKQARITKEYLVAFQRDERPIHLAIKMVDQDGCPASNFQFKLALTRLHRLLWVISWTSDECYRLTTDKDGLAMLNKPGKKAGLAILREVSIGRYVFSKSLREMGTVSMSKLTDVPQPVQFKVIRHGPPPMLIHFSTTYKEYPAEDANVIGVDLARPTAVHAPSGGVTLRMQEIGKGSMDGLLLLRIENASRAAIEEMKIMKWSKERPAEKPAEWSMTVDGNGRFMLASAADEFVSSAPGGVYDERITWNRTVTQNQGGGISQCFYAKDGITGRYSWLKIAVGLRYKKMLDVYIEGLTNPEGSTNLYEDVWPDKEAFDRYVRSCP